MLGGSWVVCTSVGVECLSSAVARVDPCSGADAWLVSGAEEVSACCIERIWRRGGRERNRLVKPLSLSDMGVDEDGFLKRSRYRRALLSTTEEGGCFMFSGETSGVMGASV